ncbi:MAG: hypothetical protein WBA13_13430 [Microcoleaceae cyanobacterium]
MNDNFIAGQQLLLNSTYRELQLRTSEYLQYRNTGSEEQQLAEDTLYNTVISFLQDMGMPQAEAEQFCESLDNLTELSLRISSILGYSS